MTPRAGQRAASGLRANYRCFSPRLITRPDTGHLSGSPSTSEFSFKWCNQQNQKGERIVPFAFRVSDLISLNPDPGLAGDAAIIIIARGVCANRKSAGPAPRWQAERLRKVRALPPRSEKKPGCFLRPLPG